jgi:hypothetical protein
VLKIVSCINWSLSPIKLIDTGNAFGKCVYVYMWSVRGHGSILHLQGGQSNTTCESSSVIRFTCHVVYLGIFDCLSHNGDAVGWQNHLALLCKLLGSACRLTV